MPHKITINYLFFNIYFKWGDGVTIVKIKIG